MSDHYDLHGARQKLGDAVHALAGRQSTHIDRDTLDRDRLDADLHARIRQAIDQHDHDMQVMRAQVKAAAAQGRPWTLARTQDETTKLDARHQARLSGIQVAHETAVVGLTTSLGQGDSLLDQLRDVHGSTTGRGSSRSARTLVHLDATELLATIDRQAAIWVSDPGTTGDRLHWLAERSYRPEDTPDIVVVADTIDGWVKKARDILTPAGHWHVVGACPECGTRTVYRPDTAGEVVRQPALSVTATGCECLACGEVWDVGRFEMLAAVLAIQACALCDQHGHRDNQICDHTKESA
jgi:hypothetical protein